MWSVGTYQRDDLIPTTLLLEAHSFDIVWRYLEISPDIHKLLNFVLNPIIVGHVFSGQPSQINTLFRIIPSLILRRIHPPPI